MLDAFGVPLSAGCGGDQPVNYERYGGAWGYLTSYDMGMMQLGARFYWPEMGRFIQQDPIGDGANWYAYVGNNPVVGIDPEGLASLSFDAYLGVGGGFTIGYQRGRGSFGKARAGFGVRMGGGLSLDPCAPSPG